MVSKWGPTTWNLFHTLVEKVKEDEFNNIKLELFYKIQNICSNLPCPDCQMHALTFLSKVNPNGITCKTDFINLICFFHNVVNKRKDKPRINIETLSEKYRNNNLIDVYNQFISNFNTRGNMKLMANNLQRQMAIKDFKKWLMLNLNKFQLP
jgi:hypothetical protein